MDKFKISPYDFPELSREYVERLVKISDVLVEQTSKASQCFEELYSFLKSIYEPSDEN